MPGRDKPEPKVSPDKFDQGEARMREHFSEEIAGNPIEGDLQHSIDESVLAPERLPTAVEERVRETGEHPKPTTDELTGQGGDRVQT